MRLFEIHMTENDPTTRKALKNKEWGLCVEIGDDETEADIVRKLKMLGLSCGETILYTVTQRGHTLIERNGKLVRK